MNDINIMPLQKIPRSKKTEAWQHDTVDYIISRAMGSTRNGNNRTRREEMQSYYDLYNGIYDERDLKYVTNPFKQKDGFPATAQDFNIIKPKIDLLLGEETKRPFNLRIVRTSDQAVSDAQNEAKQLLEDYIMATIYSKLGPEEAAQYQQALQNGEIMPPESIAKYMNQDYKDIAESTAYHSMQYLVQKDNLKHEFFKGFADGLKSGEEIYYIGIRNGQPIAERVNPIYFDYDSDCSDMEFIHEAEWQCYEMYMSVSTAYDKFYDKLSEKQLTQLIEMAEDGSRGGIEPELRKYAMDYPHIKTHSINGFVTNPFDERDSLRIWHVCWRSYRKIGFVTLYDPETDQNREFEVDESYKVTGTEVSVEWKWIIENWEGYRAGEDMYFGVGPIEYQYVSADNPNAARLPYTGCIYNNNNSRPRSLVSIMKPLQYLYIIVWYRLELAMARDKGKVLTMDITQIPQSMNIDVPKWMHYLSALGVNFVNPYDDSYDIPGRSAGHPSPFNQISALDLSMVNTVQQYIGILEKIEEMIDQISGITRQRQGSVSSSELVGNVERSVIQSAHITEPWFWMHNQVKKEVITMLLNTAKYAWKDSKTCLSYIMDDANRAFITLNDNFFYEDFDIFVDDSTKAQQNLEAIRNLMQPAMQNGASLLDIAEIIAMDDTNMIKEKLQEIEEKRMQQQQEMQQQEAEQQQQLVQMQNQVKEQELQLKQAELELDKYKVDQDNATKIAVAQIGAYRYTQDMDQNQNGVPDPLEIGKQALEQQKVIAEDQNKKMEIQNKRQTEREKIQLEREKLDAQMKLQQQKDKAALEREKIKARTALKNKTNAEAARSK